VGTMVITLRARLRRYWRAWLSLALLVAAAGGFVLTAAAAGHRTDTAFPQFTARHGDDVIVYSGQPLPQLARLPDVSSATTVPVTVSDTPRCPSCRAPIDASNFLVNEVPGQRLPRVAALLSGRMPRATAPDEVLASFTLARDNGVRVGSAIQLRLGTPAELNGGPADPSPLLRPTVRVVGIAVAESEFPAGASPHYDLYATPAYAAAENQRAALLWTYYVRLAHGPADLAGFDSRLRALHVYGTDDLDAAAVAVQASIRPQVIGWYLLAALTALAALAVIGQAMARQTAAERADQPVLAALGVRPRQFALLALARAVLVAMAGAAGAVLVALLASPLTPVGEARLAVPAAGAMSLDLAVVPLGALAVLAAVVAVSAWPALRQGRRQAARLERQPGPAAPVVVAGQAAVWARLPPPALIGIRYAFYRGRDGTPVGTALLGTALAVAALCATAVFGASLAHLVSSPELYGAPFQAYFGSDGEPGSQEQVNGPLLASLRRDPAIAQLTVGAFVEANVNGRHVRTVVMTPARGPALLSAVDGRLPAGDRDIMLGVSTMRAAGTRVGGAVRVTVADPEGAPHQASFRVIGRASLNAGTGGLGDGAVLTTSAFIGLQCPAGPRQVACRAAVSQGLPTVLLVRAVPGPAGDAALARYIARYPDLTYRPATPTVLVNFGESVNFPLLFAVALSVFGAATLLHLLLVSRARRRAETGLLKALGFVRRQVAAAFCWQATAVAVAGAVVGVPAGIAAGRLLWRVFATNFGVVPVAVTDPVLTVALAAAVLAAANLLAVVPALLAARPRPAVLLRGE